MDSESAVRAGIDVDGLSVRLDRSLRIGSLRYFHAAGSVSTIAGVVGGSLPKALQAALQATGSPGAGRKDSEFILAFRSPTETLLLSDDAEWFESIASLAAGRSDGCLVEQTAGIWAWTVTGARTRDLLTRLGAPSMIPALGEARTGRLADVAVMSVCVRPGEILLLVERVYSRHLMEWIAATVDDF
jgi:hypothetical protein